MMTTAETTRGKETREKMLCAAAELIHRKGVNATSVDDILAASDTGKSQFYHYFGSKERLVREVLRHQSERYFREQAELLKNLDSWEGIEAWFEATADCQQQRKCVGGCPFGSMAAEMADLDDELRAELAGWFDQWQAAMARGLACMRAKGLLREEADADRLAEFLAAAIEGGMLLAKTRRDVAPLRTAQAGALAYLRSLAADTAGTS